jgi:hypothetical protein
MKSASVKRPKVPCMSDCPGRTAECHSTCEKYIDYYEKQRRHSEKVSEERRLDRGLRGKDQ